MFLDSNNHYQYFSGEDYNSSEIITTFVPPLLVPDIITYSAVVPINDDSFVEATETFSFSVTSPQPLALSAGSITSASVEITDDDGEMHGHL